MKDLKDWTWDELIDHAAGEILKGLIAGQLRSSIASQFIVMCNWLKENGKMK